jgi:hypothetical protein
MNIHDELMCPTKESYIKTLTKSVKEAVNQFKEKVPLLAIEWFENIPNWASKKG